MTSGHAVFDALLQKAELGGLRVRLPRSRRDLREQVAEFSTHKDGKKRPHPVIVLRFDEGADAHRFTDDDAIRLAHEMGHWRRSLGDMHPRYRTDILETAGAAAQLYREPLLLPVELRRVVYAEESAAWDLGRAELEAVSFENWTLFDALRDESLSGYRTGLGL